MMGGEGCGLGGLGAVGLILFFVLLLWWLLVFSAATMTTTLPGAKRSHQRDTVNGGDKIKCDFRAICM